MKIPVYWLDLFEALPNYDPVATAGLSHFDAGEAQRWVDFIEKRCVHVKGEWAGQPLTLNRWERAYVGCLFGWQRPDGTRRYRESLLAMPRKGGKSTLGAALGAGLMYMDGEPGAEIYSAAGDRDQAAIVFGIAKAMIEADPELAEVSQIYTKAILAGSSTWKVLSADVPRKHGANAHGILFDELHVQPNRDLWDVLTTSPAARRQPLTIAITTAGTDKESICWEIWQYAEKVRDGTVSDASFLPVIFAAPLDADWTDPATWAQANPTYPDAPKHEYLEAKCKKAQETPGLENTFKRLHLNLWTDATTRWISSADWKKNEGAADVPAGSMGYGGLDLASTDDIAAFTCVFPDESTGDYRVLSRFWVPEEKLAMRVRRHRVPYDVWQRAGWLTVTEGNVIDYARVRADIVAFCAQYPLQEIAYDPWNAQQLVSELQDQDGLPMVLMRQGFVTLSGPTKETGKLIRAGRLRTGANPVLRWMAGNVVVKQDEAENLKPDKKKSTEKIDGMVALIMAIGRAVVGDGGPSVYEERGLLSV